MDSSKTKYWLNEIKACEERQKKDLVDRGCYPDIIKYYEGKLLYQPNLAESQQKDVEAVINEFFPNTNSIIADIMYKFPEVQVEAKKEVAEPTVDLMKAALDYAVRQTAVLDESRLALFDMIYAGYCAIEVSHQVDSGKYLETADTVSTINKPNANFIDTAISAVKKVFTDRETAEQVESKMAPEEERYGTTEKTYVRRIDPLNVFLDYRADRIKDLRYIVKKIVMSKAEFNVAYPEFADRVKGEGKLEYAQHDNQINNMVVTVYEVQVRKKNNVYTNICLTPSITDKPLKVYDRPYITNGFDIKIGSLHKYGKLYPISIARINKYINDRQNSYVRYMMEVAERTIPKVLVDRNSVDLRAKEALMSPKVNDVVEIDGVNKVVPAEFGKVSIENKELMQIFASVKEKLWSVSESRLTGKSTSEFATEIQIQEAGFQAKQGDLQEGLRDVLQQVLESLKDIVKQLWDGEYFFKVTGKGIPDWYQTDVAMVNGQPIAVNALADILVGDYDVSVDITSAMRPNKEKKRKDFVDFLMFMLNPQVTGILMQDGMSIDPAFIKRAAEEFGFNPEIVFTQAQIPVQGPGMEVSPTPMELAMQDQGATVGGGI